MAFHHKPATANKVYETWNSKFREATLKRHKDYKRLSNVICNKNYYFTKKEQNGSKWGVREDMFLPECCPLQYCQKLWKFLRQITKEVRARKFKIAGCPLNTRTVETLKSAAWAATTASPNSVLYFDPAPRLWTLDFFPQIWNAKNNLNLYFTANPLYRRLHNGLKESELQKWKLRCPFSC